MIAAEPLPARLVIVEAQTAGPEALARYERTREGLVPYLLACREQSPHAGELPETLEEAILGGVAWLLHQRLVSGSTKELGDLYPELVDIVIAPYVGEDAAAGLVSSPAR